MTDILIRGMSDESVARIEEQASKLGLSRNEYLRRQLDALAAVQRETPAEISLDDLRRASHAARDLDDPDVMAAAWR
ncbi:type II toxin-antitoxin system VapB family antitoxin [Microcella sp.]|uniref:type II toxin-antitoxin system VapB family antitoxin n=1 Tax=Microcella sp. TaxID=1913979 RepID=UPI003F72A116